MLIENYDLVSQLFKRLVNQVHYEITFFLFLKSVFMKSVFSSRNFIYFLHLFLGLSSAYKSVSSSAICLHIYLHEST